MLKLFRALDRNPQWLAAWTLIALVGTLASGHVLSGVAAPLAEKTGFKLVDLQFSGWYPILDAIRPGQRSVNDLLASVGFETHRASDIIQAWQKAGLLETARRAQRIDFVFAAAYGVFALLLAVTLWRIQPEYPRRVRSVRLIALGTIAAALDEIENVGLWTVLRGSGDAGEVSFLLPTAVATLKVVFLIAALVGLVVSFVRAHNAFESSAEIPTDAADRRPGPSA